jgi:hypothetical protein
MSYESRPRGSSRGITVEQYVSTIPYETMPFVENLFSSLVNDDNIIKIFDDRVPFNTKIITEKLKEYRDSFDTTKNKDIKYTNVVSNNVLKREILYYLLQYRLYELYYDTQRIDLAKVEAPDTDTDPVKGKSARIRRKNQLNDDIQRLTKKTRTIQEDSELEKHKADLYQIEENEKLASNRTLYILPTIDSAQSENIKASMKKEIKSVEIYNDLLTSKNNPKYDNIFLLPVFSARGDSLEEFKARIDQELKNLSEKILDKSKSDTTAYTKIIYYVDNEKDKHFYTGFFEKGLKKEYISELDNKLKNFFVTRIGNQQLSLNYKPFYSDIAGLKSNNIRLNVKQISSLDGINDSITALIECIKNCYLSYTDSDTRKSLSENVNINTFHIYTRLENLDDSDPMGTVVASRDYYYLFLEKGKYPKLGHLEVSNLSKNQYFFVLDTTEGIFKKWASAVYEYKNPDETIKLKPDEKSEYNDADKTVTIKTRDANQIKKIYKDGEVIDFNIDNKSTWSNEYKKYVKKFKSEKKDQDDMPLEKLKNTDDKNKDVKRTLIQVRYNYGQIQFKNIQNKLNSPYIGVLKFETIDRDYEKYDWFTFNSIDRALEPKKSINYYADTIFDKDSLREYLKSENKFNEKTRLAYEFLKMNYNIPELKKYADYIYDNFKGNINFNLNDSTFVEKIKRSIVDLVFENNGLIYVKKSNIIAQKEKEKADADNYKILNCNYVSIRNRVVDQEVKNYFNRNDSEETLYLKNKNKNFREIKTVLNNQEKRTGCFAIVQITRDVIGDTSSLFFAAECKKRTRRIKGKIKKAMNFFLEGGRTKKIKRTRRYYRT